MELSLMGVGGIDFDFDEPDPDPWRLRIFFEKQFAAGTLPRDARRELNERKRGAAGCSIRVNDQWRVVFDG